MFLCSADIFVIGRPVNAKVEKGVCQQICESGNVLNCQVSSLAGVLMWHHYYISTSLREVPPQKNWFYLGLCPKLWVGGGQES